ncbi:MAG: 4Fe-4S dicluster domain-containing protein [Bacillota bacterium]|nr:4Fe-4S dicluster domain-containing protein [Bacillota bacterium]
MPQESLIDIYIMGKKYAVPESLTIMRAMEFAGYQLKRGCGCRTGICGACATVYRIAGDHEFKVGLACQIRVESGMHLAQIPFYPPLKGIYNIDNLPPSASSIKAYYPEIYRCIGCNSCTKVCPQNINVKQYIAYARKGDIAGCAFESFDCIMCGLCAYRCPAQIAQYNVGILARRLFGKYLLPRDLQLQQRVDEIQGGKYETELQRLMKLDIQELNNHYYSRDIEA